MARALGLSPSEAVARLQDRDPELVFALAAAAEARERELRKWEVTWDWLEALRDTIAEAFSK